MTTGQLGRTGLKVTQLGFGAMELRGAGYGAGRQIGETQCERILHAVLDAGINFIDTSVDYGLSEERIGRHISRRRNEYVLATKCGCDPVDKGGQGRHVWTRDHLFRNIEGSLQRLRTDHVDVLQLHGPEPEHVRAGGLVEAMLDIQAQGMTRFIGISTVLPELCQFLKMGAFDTFQVPYSCLQRGHHKTITAVAEAGCGVIVRGGIGHGGPESDLPQRVRFDLWEKAGLTEMLEGMTPAELILRYTLSHPHCHTAIVGTLNVEHLAANVAGAAKGPLDAPSYERITR